MTTMHLLDIEDQIKALQDKADALRATNDPELPAAWRKRDRAGWYKYLQLQPHQHEMFAQDGWVPLYHRQKAMAEAKASVLARSHNGVALVRATEAHHGIH
jgi:hypothetical protein